MKHLLNNLSEEEKNSIREQHTGGKKIMIENFNKLVNTKLGDAKPLTEQEEETKDIMGLYESVIITSVDENEWCKKNVTDTENQICIIKTPNSGDKNICQTTTGNTARQNGYVNPIKIDVTEPNFCKAIWEKIK